jgi:hypothetical protein
MTDWKRVYQVSRNCIRAQAASGLFVAAIYTIIAIFGFVLLSSGQSVVTPLGALLMALGLLGAYFLGRRALREYLGGPLVLTARILLKQDAMSYNHYGTLHRYYLRIEVGQAMRLAPNGELEIAIYPRYEQIPASDKLYKSLRDGDSVTLLCTPAGYAFATLDDMVNEWSDESVNE